MEFKKVDGTKVDLVEYTKEYMQKHPDIEIIIGCDSQNRGKSTYYAVVEALYTPGHGAHVIFRRWRTPEERVTSVRLLNEAWFSVEAAEELKKAGKKPKWIDLDLNPSAKYKSNEVLKQAIGLCEGTGYKVRFKTLAPIVTTYADFLVRE
jgi:predicted RNase H-related nuclease YkuK (DUF458 family)